MSRLLAFRFKFIGKLKSGGSMVMHSKLAAASMGHERSVRQRQIDAPDRQIDRLV